MSTNQICRFDGCNQTATIRELCKRHYRNEYAKQKRSDPKWAEQNRKNALATYYKHHDSYKKKKRKYEKKHFEKIIKVLGSKCDACNERYQRDLPRSNLDLHHKFYTDADKTYFKKYGVMPGKQEALRMIKSEQISELKMKYILLCQQCNLIEAWVRKNPKKGFETFAWLYGEGHFDEVLKDDTDNSTIKKLTEFMK